MDAIVRALVASPGGKAIQAAFTHGINTMKLVRPRRPDGLRQSGIAAATSLKASLVETKLAVAIVDGRTDDGYRRDQAHGKAHRRTRPRSSAASNAVGSIRQHGSRHGSGRLNGDARAAQAEP